MTERTFAIAAAMALMLALGAFGLETRSDYDASVDFTALESFRWVGGTAADAPVLQRSIESAVRSQLEAKGLSENAEAPDIWVVTHASIENRLAVDPRDYDYDYRWRSWGPTSVNFRDLEAGSLVVDLVDAQTKEMIWRGILLETISPKLKKAEKSAKSIPKGVEKLFKDFPPEE